MLHAHTDAIKPPGHQAARPEGVDETRSTNLRRWMKNPIHSVLVLGVLAMVIAIVVCQTYLIDQRSRELAHATEEATTVSRILVEQTIRSLQGVDLVMTGVAERLHLLAPRREGIDGHLAHLLLSSRIASLPHVSALFMTDARGFVIASSAEYPVRRVSATDRDYFRIPKASAKSEVFVGSPLIDRLSGQWTLHMSRRIEMADGSFSGVIVAALNLEHFERLHDLQLDYIAPITLYLNNGLLVARAPRDETLIGRHFALPLRAAGSTDSWRIERVGGERPGVIIYRDIAGFPLTLAVASPESAALAEWRGDRQNILFGAAVVIAVIAAVTWLLVRELKLEQALARRLLEAGEALEAMVTSAMDAIVTIDARQRIVLFNPAAEAMFGCPALDALGTSLERFLPERFRGAHAGNLTRFGRGPTESRAMNAGREIVGLRASGQEFPVEAAISHVLVNQQSYFTAILRDVSNRRRAEAELRQTNNELRRLSESLITIREEERGRIARELHDELGQQLMRFRLDLSWLANRLRGPTPELADKVKAMQGLVADTVAAVRRINTELRPPMLDDLGLVAAAEWLLDDFRQRTGATVDVQTDGRSDGCDAATATAAYRILQEALTNIARHAEATRVRVRLNLHGESLHLDIEDNGKGMQSAPGRSANTGNGLVGMRERVLMLGGTLTFAEAGGGGTAVSVRLPAQRPAVAPAAGTEHRAH